MHSPSRQGATMSLRRSAIERPTRLSSRQKNQNKFEKKCLWKKDRFFVVNRVTFLSGPCFYRPVFLRAFLFASRAHIAPTRRRSATMKTIHRACRRAKKKFGERQYEAATSRQPKGPIGKKRFCRHEKLQKSTQVEIRREGMIACRFSCDAFLAALEARSLFLPEKIQIATTATAAIL